MPYDSKLIALIAIGFVLPLTFGFLAARVRLPPLVGYLLAGIAIGPFTPGFVADADLASELALEMTDYALRSRGVSEERSKLVTQWPRNEELSRPES